MKKSNFCCFIFSLLVLSIVPYFLRKRPATSPPEKRSDQPPFFVNGSPPMGLPGTSQGIEIQQKLPGDHSDTPPYFVSLFDPSTNTPFYSAYKVTPVQSKDIGKEAKLSRRKWRDPPGVPDLHNAYKEAIETNKQRLGGPGRKVKHSQELTRGHLNPSAINSFDRKFMAATYTLTNAVPQFAASNIVLTEFESIVTGDAKNCGNKGGTLYLLTGRSENGLVLTDPEKKPVQDLKNQIPKPFQTDTFAQGKIKLVTPRSIWTAGCCIWQVQGGAKRAESFAVMNNNQDKKSKVHQTKMSVHELEKLLATPPTAEVNLFPGEEECRRPGSRTQRREYQ